MIAIAAFGFALRSGNRTLPLIGGAAIGALAAIGWVGTGYVLLDEFDPIAMESLSFTSPAADGLFFAVASTSIPAGFGPGLIGGVLAGALVAALMFGSFNGKASHPRPRRAATARARRLWVWVAYWQVAVPSAQACQACRHCPSLPSSPCSASQAELWR